MKSYRVVKLFFPFLAGVLTFLPLASTDAKEEPKNPPGLTIHSEPSKLDADAITIHFGPGPSGAIAIHFGHGPGDAKAIHFGPGPSSLKSIHFGPGPTATNDMQFGSSPNAARTVSIHFGPGPSDSIAMAENEPNKNKESIEKLE